jgi:hypothetical protein
VGRVGFVGRLRGQPREQLHEPRHLRVAPDGVPPGLRDVGAPGEPDGVELVAASEHLGEQGLLVAEVVQDARLREADRVGYLAQRGAAEAALGDDVERGPEDLLALGDALGVRAPSCHARHGTGLVRENLALYGFEPEHPRRRSSP